MRTLSVHNRYKIRGGEDESREAEERVLRNHGHDVDVYEEDNERVRTLGIGRTAMRTVWSGESYDMLRRRMAQHRYDVMHVQNFFPLISPSVYYAAKDAGVPVVQSLRNYRLLCPGAQFFRDGKVCEDCLGKSIPWPGIVHKCYRGSLGGSSAVTVMLTVHRAARTWTSMVDLYVALTEFSRQKFIEGGFPADKIVVKPNFVDPDPGPGKGTGGYAVFLGRLSEEKGLSTMLSAWEKLGHRLPLKIIGDGPMGPQVAATAQRLGTVELLGRMAARQAYDVVGEASMLILPSQWYETFGRVAVEAFAKGTPVVASNLGAMAELVEHGRNGRLFEAGDSEDLVRQVEQLLENPAALSAMRAEARLEYEAKYTPGRNYAMMMDIYRTAMARCPVGAP